MAKSRRKQAINKQKQEKAKNLRKRKAEDAAMTALIQPYLDKADRHIDEAKALFKQAMLEREEEHQPGFSIPPPHAMRFYHDALENNKGFRSAFHTLPVDWRPPIVKDTRYGLVHRHYANSFPLPLKYGLLVYLASLNAYRKIIGSNVDRELCSECAKYDWRHHLTAFFEGLPADWATVATPVCTVDEETVLATSLGGEYELDRYSTSFKLPGLTHAIEHKQICTFCSLLVSALSVEATKAQFDHIAKDAQPVEISCYSPFDESNHDHWTLYARFCSDEKVAHGDWDVVILRFTLYNASASITSDAFINEAVRKAGRGTVAPTQIDPALIPLWWQQCKEGHVGCQRRARQLKRDRADSKIPLRVIDVQKNEVVVAPAGCQYLALSYVWGGIDGYLSRKSDKTRDLLTEDEIIPIKRKRLPRTIRHAMRVTEMIGERYLWVDAVSIVQDDDSEKAKIIAVMNMIYQGAILTIVAADGKNANVGLVGLDPGSRHVQSVVGSVDNIFLILQEPAPELGHAVWSSRAWTYQEEQFSHRLLVFAHDRVYYKCSEGSFGEARPLQQLTDPIIETELDAKLANIDDGSYQALYAYTKLVQGYTSRQLSYERDILHAFEGILSHISSISPERYMFFWGLPQLDLVLTLAWRAASSQTPLRRRTAQTRYYNGTAQLMHRKNVEPRDTAIDFPSWSWAGWVGPVVYNIFEYPRSSCWGSTGCSLSPTLDFSFERKDETAHELPNIWSLGILTLTADVATFKYDHIREYKKYCADDDSCEGCRGQTQVHTRVLTMDDGTVWKSGDKEGFLLLEALGFVDDFQSHTVLLFRRDAETGLCQREGLVELQRREWEAAETARELLRLR
ncbi:hypothetical protein LTR10_004301 [Elasticomyces elasticus]|nr:hypothetical protein LTR10_004301 [Elasticomyces elasticus]